jgi:hypothetical protein
MVEDTNTEPQQDMVGSDIVDYNDANNQYPEFTPAPVDKRPLIIGIVVAAAILLISIIIAVWLFLNPVTAEIVRDIVIIFLGISSFFILICLVIMIVMLTYLILKTNDLVQLLDREVRPLLYNIQETTNTVRGTTTFLSDKAVQPVIATVSSIAAVKAFFRSLFRR